MALVLSGSNIAWMLFIAGLVYGDKHMVAYGFLAAALSWFANAVNETMPHTENKKVTAIVWVFFASSAFAAAILGGITLILYAYA